MDLRRDYPDPLAAAAAGPLELDRQRVVHSSAFRRLQYKTQAFLSQDQDHFRTRLTHTLEVAQLARMLARALGANAELAEVAALAHDVGHPPFGHAGERALNQCLAKQGGFEHNAHALRVVEYLEHPYPEFRGLNLTRVVRECLAKHTTGFDAPGAHPLQDGRPPPLEGQIAALADRLAYGLHDMQDAIFAELFDPSELETLELWHAHYHGPPPSARAGWRGRLRPAIDRIQQALLADVAAQAQSAGPVAVSLSPEMERSFAAWEQFLLRHAYRHHRVVRMDAKAIRMLTAVFDAYIAEPDLLPPRFRARLDEQGTPRVAADYIAGMTDRFCLREHARLFDPGIEP